jgi:hypothetical protein
LIKSKSVIPTKAKLYKNQLVMFRFLPKEQLIQYFLKAQRKAREAEGIPGFLAFDFLCVLNASVVDGFFMGF